MSSSRLARRGIGRPRQGAGADARELLLDAALRLFSEQGIAGTTVAAIAARAGVTPAMVHYYFKDRERLLDAIAAERLLKTITGVWQPVMETDAVVPMVRGIVQRILEATARNPWLPSLWLREIVSEGGQLRDRLIKCVPFESVRHLVDSIAAAQRRGALSPDLEPRLMLLTVIGLTLLPLATIRMWQVLPVLKGVTREDVARHAEALLVSALSAPVRPRPKSA
jgi:TetR/AcrR family transcriptional regulator